MALRFVLFSALTVCSIHGFSLAPSLRLPHSAVHAKSAVSHRGYTPVVPLRADSRPWNRGVSLNMVAAMDSDTETDKEKEQGPPIKYLSVEEAKAIEEELMDPSTGGYPLGTLLELRGQSLAESIGNMYPPEQLDGYKVLVVCGPGNSGGYGLVATRYLYQMGYEVEVVYPNRNNQPEFVALVNQLKAVDVRVNMGMPGTANRCALMVDAIFDFDFDGEIGPPFDFTLKQMRNPEFFGTVPIVSIDVPSGWDAERGPPEDTEMRLEPDLLVSMTAPKMFARKFTGMHHLGGRVVPPRMMFQYKLNLPAFKGKEQWTDLPPPPPLSEEEEEEEEARLAELEEKKAAAEAAAEAAAGDVPQELGSPFASFEQVAFGGGAAAAGAEGAAAFGPAAWPDPDPAMQTKINEACERALRVVGEKRDGWDQQIRQLVAAQLAPMGWTSEYPPDKTTIAKVCFVAAKTLADRGFDNMDVLSEGRAIAEGAFEQDGDMAAGKILRGLAGLYGANGEGEMQKIVLEEVERVRSEKGYPEDLEPPPQRPGYTMADKWTVSVEGPEGLNEDFEVVLRPQQKVGLLMKAWFGQNDVDPADEGKFEFFVPEVPKTWRSGVVADKESEIGATGLLDGTTLMVRRKEEAAASEEASEEEAA